MGEAESKYRDQILRAYFKGRNWDANYEFLLKRKLVLNSHELLPSFPFLIDDEWEVEPNRSQQGKGDLLFSDGLGNFAVVEVKYIDLENTGSTASNRRTKKRSLVIEQTKEYTNALASHLKKFVKIEGYIYTNEVNAPQCVISLP